jgi:histidinol-phosphatase (PHP family)
MMTIPLDYHIHTDFSCDSDATMIEMCRSAIEKGIPEIGFSEHFDLMPQEECRNYLQVDAFWEDLLECRRAFRGSLIIRAGVELGEPHHFKDEVADLLNQYPWDYSLASMHWVGSGNIFYPEFFEQPAEQVYRPYFLELARMAAEAEFDVVAHFDMVKRRGFDAYGVFDPCDYENEIRNVLKTLAEKDRALEVNTATLRRPVKELCPGVTILKWFKEAGGKWITLGSDAHRPDQVGYGLLQALAMLRSAGFEYLAGFEARQATPIQLL